jgi:hypothetical protein
LAEFPKQFLYLLQKWEFGSGQQTVAAAADGLFHTVPEMAELHAPSLHKRDAVTKVQDSSGKSRKNKSTRQLTLQPVAAEASMEAMKCLKPLV